MKLECLHCLPFSIYADVKANSRGYLLISSPIKDSLLILQNSSAIKVHFRLPLAWLRLFPEQITRFIHNNNHIANGLATVGRACYMWPSNIWDYEKWREIRPIDILRRWGGSIEEREKVYRRLSKIENNQATHTPVFSKRQRIITM